MHQSKKLSVSATFFVCRAAFGEKIFVVNVGKVA